MIPRYSPPDMAALFSDAARFAMWLEVELLATEARPFIAADDLVEKGRRQMLPVLDGPAAGHDDGITQSVGEQPARARDDL